jgi:hypothetical protein
VWKKTSSGTLKQAVLEPFDDMSRPRQFTITAMAGQQFSKTAVHDCRAQDADCRSCDAGSLI